MAAKTNDYFRLGKATFAFVLDPGDTFYQPGIEFLRTDIALGMTFARIALRSTDRKKVTRIPFMPGRSITRSLSS
jgi:hypothetical protein